jgi:hypothetical protein
MCDYIWGALVCFHPIHISIKLGSEYTKIQIYDRWVPMIKVPLSYTPFWGKRVCSFVNLFLNEKICRHFGNFKMILRGQI